MNQSRTIRIISLLAILAIFAIVMYAIVPKYANNLKSSTPSPFSISTSSPSPTLARILTPEEQAVLDIPLHYASAEEKKQHTQQVAKLAATASELDITACRPNPTVYQTSLKGSFTIKNNDAVPHTLRYMSSQVLVPAQSSTTVKISQLFKVAGDYGYGCDNPFAKHGLLVVR